MYTWPAVRVHDVANIPDSGLEDAVRAGIGHHQRSKFARMPLGLGAQVGDVDVAVPVASHHDDLQTGHGSARRIGAMRARRNEADAPLRVAARLVPGANGEQAGELALAAGIRLQADGGKTRGLGEIMAQPGDQQLIAARLAGGANGWMPAKPGQEIGIISAAAFSFMVQEPSGIMPRFRAMSRSSRRLR